LLRSFIDHLHRLKAGGICRSRNHKVLLDLTQRHLSRFQTPSGRYFGMIVGLGCH
jgi:hypothetical protein